MKTRDAIIPVHAGTVAHAKYRIESIVADIEAQPDTPLTPERIQYALGFLETADILRIIQAKEINAYRERLRTLL